RAASTILLVSVLGAIPLSVLGQSPVGRWVGTWATAPVGRPQTPPPPGPPGPPPFMASACPRPATPPPPAPPPGQTFGPQPYVQFTNQTLRQIVHTSLGGRRARVVFSNAFGTLPVTIGAAHIAVRAKDDAIVPMGGGALTFAGRPTMTIPANAV